MKIYYYFLVLFISTFSFSQNLSTLKGTVKDGEGNPLPFANVLVSGKGGAITDQNGAYSISLLQGNYEITVSYIGYQTFKESLNINEQSLVLNIVLREDVSALQGVEVYGKTARG